MEDDSNEYRHLSRSELTLYHPLNYLKREDLIKNGKDRLLERTNIKLLTYNIFLRPPLIKNNENDWKDERLEDFIEIMHEFDVICLQELFSLFNSRRPRLIRRANKQGFFFSVSTETPTFFSKYVSDGAMTILSRFPIVCYTFYSFQFGVVVDSLARKGILYAKLKIKGSYLHLFTTHLQASYLDSSKSHWDISYMTRMSQIRQINHFVIETLKEAKYNKGRDKVMIVGDLNVDANQYMYKQRVRLLKL